MAVAPGPAPARAEVRTQGDILVAVPGGDWRFRSPGLQSVSQVSLRSVATSGTTALTSGTTAASLATLISWMACPCRTTPTCRHSAAARATARWNPRQDGAGVFLQVGRLPCRPLAPEATEAGGFADWGGDGPGAVHHAGKRLPGTG
jgi:hypothetical protein